MSLDSQRSESHRSERQRGDCRRSRRNRGSERRCSDRTPIKKFMLKYPYDEKTGDR